MCVWTFTAQVCNRPAGSADEADRDHVERLVTGTRRFRQMLLNNLPRLGPLC